MMPKLDGAHTLIDLKDTGKVPRLFSYRKAKRALSGVIEHTHKVPSLLEQRVPEGYANTLLRAETIAITDKGKSLPARQIAGMLNSSVPVSRETQKELGATLKPIAFDIVKYKGENVENRPFKERYDLLKDVASKTDIEIVDVAHTNQEKLKLLRTIERGNHPLTNEGVVLRPLEGNAHPAKAKFRPDHDVYVRSIFEATNAQGKPVGRAGGFEFSWTPKGPVVGRVGTGFTHDLAKDMLSNPDKYKGRVAKVHAEQKYESGALGKASFQEWHLDKGKTAEEKDAPDYGPATTITQNCAKCKHYTSRDVTQGACTKYDFTALTHYSCDAWEKHPTSFIRTKLRGI
jgi:ATP-dependent DNA ligase